MPLAGWLALLLALAGSSCSRSGPSGSGPGTSQPGGKAPDAWVRIGQHEWAVELATTPEARQLGLGHRDSVPEGTGMLFVFPQANVVEFHMLNCRVPLDAAFISPDLKVVSARHMPVEQDPANPRTLYSSRQPVLYVLEVAGGALDRASVRPGDEVALVRRAANAAKEAR